MAGMGEACSHVGALLFYIEAGVRFLRDESCTDRKNVWIQPQMKDVEFNKIKDINFESPSMKLKKDSALKTRKRQRSLPDIAEPSDVELHQFYAELDSANLSSAVLMVVEPFNNKFVQDNDIIKELTNLYSIEYSGMNWQQLLEKCKDVVKSIVITKSDSEKIEKETKMQWKSRKWFMYRTGRVTASSMKAVCRTDIDCPGKSVLKKICYPSVTKISTAATQWGNQHENVAREKYICKMKESHENFNLTESGFHINPKFPYMGASPDAITNCDCCGQGIIEIKCPYATRNCTVIDMCLQDSSFLVEDDIGNICLDKQHDYHYQVQTQLLVTDVNHCDFIVWTNEDFFVERIYHDELFQETICEKSFIYFNLCVLPELLAKWHSKNE